MSLLQEMSVIFGLRGGNKDFLVAQRTILQSLIDQVEEIRGLCYQHEPFNCDLYWTDLYDSNATVSGTSVVDFSNDIKTLLVEARSDIENLIIKVREFKHEHVTNYSDVYKAANIIMDQALKQWANYTKLILIPYTDHSADSNDLSLFAVDSNVLSSSMTASDAVQAALDAGSMVDHARFHFDSNTDPDTTVYRKTHVGNMNMQSLRTYKRIIESLKGVWPRASVSLAKMNGKYAGSDMTSAGAPITAVSTKFSEFLNYIGSLTAVGSYLVTEADEYMEAARPTSDDSVISFSTDSLKSAIKGFASYFDGSTATVDANTPISSDLSAKIGDVCSELIAGSFDPESPSDYGFLSNVL